jgi:hypothetical protein
VEPGDLFKAVVAAAMILAFVLTFWAPVGGLVATAVARAKADYALTANDYLPIQRLEPVY